MTGLAIKNLKRTYSFQHLNAKRNIKEVGFLFLFIIWFNKFNQASFVRGVFLKCIYSFTETSRKKKTQEQEKEGKTHVFFERERSTRENR